MSSANAAPPWVMSRTNRRSSQKHSNSAARRRDRNRPQTDFGLGNVPHQWIPFVSANHVIPIVTQGGRDELNPYLLEFEMAYSMKSNFVIQEVQILSWATASPGPVVKPACRRKQMSEAGWIKSTGSVLSSEIELSLWPSTFVLGRTKG